MEGSVDLFVVVRHRLAQRAQPLYGSNALRAGGAGQHFALALLPAEVVLCDACCESNVSLEGCHRGASTSTAKRVWRQTMGLRGQGRRVASQLRAAMTLPDARGASARWLSAAAAVPGCDARPGMAVQRAVSQLVRACPTARWLV
jgi:hypothetical protein